MLRNLPQHEPASFAINVDIIRANIRLSNEMMNMKTTLLEYVKEICTLRRLYSEEKIENVRKTCFNKELENENKHLKTRIQILNEQAFTADLIQLD